MERNVTRRDFIKHGTAGLAAVSAASCFIPGNIYGVERKTGSKMELHYYYEHFGVNEQIINEIIATALSKGGEYADVFFQHTIDDFIALEDKAVNRAFSDVSFGVGIRVLNGDQTGYSFTEEVTPEAMKAAAKTAANIAGLKKKVAPQELKLRTNPNYYPTKKSWEDVSIDQKIPILETINDKVFGLDNRVLKCSVSLSNSSTYMLLATSDGIVTFDYQPMCRAGVNVTAEQDGRREQNGFNFSSRTGMEFFTPEKINTLANESVARTVKLFEAIKPKAGEMPVVLAAGSSGILLHEAIGHGMEADFNRKDVSIFSDKINKKVAEKFVNIIDDGTNPGMRGSINIDDEGNESQKTYLVQDGILTSYLHDRISARYYGVTPTGNGRRQSFRFVPMPRMRNTYMENGPHKKDEIIASVKNGLFAESFTNGEVAIGAGDFTFYVKTGRLIENGKLTTPVKDINIIGNGPDVLTKVTMVADDFQFDVGGWTCGKNGQGVPVSLGLPTIKVSSITVGGVNS